MNEQNKDVAHSDADSLTKARSIYQELLTTRQSVMLATTRTDGTPLASYAPFAVDANTNFYIFISTLSLHTGNLMRTGKASVMLIADEAESEQIFARHRLTYACHAEELARDDPNWQEAAALYRQRFGEFFDLVRGFRDFKMFRLTPEDGLLVVGFGQAYNIHGNAPGQLSLRRGTPPEDKI
ncbi:MAG: pyridoxamine 5'-phosphate oxidase family protein [Chloroflexota bacterium]